MVGGRSLWRDFEWLSRAAPAEPSLGANAARRRLALPFHALWKGLAGGSPYQLMRPPQLPPDEIRRGQVSIFNTRCKLVV